MQITVSDLKEYLNGYDDEAIVKFAVSSKNGISIVHNYGFISVSTEEVHGKEIVIHSYYGDDVDADRTVEGLRHV